MRVQSQSYFYGRWKKTLSKEYLPCGGETFLFTHVRSELKIRLYFRDNKFWLGSPRRRSFRCLAADAGLVLAAAPAAGAGVVRLGSAHCTLHTATESGENVLKLKTHVGCVYLLQY